MQLPDIPDDVTPVMVCGPFPERDVDGYKKVACADCGTTLWASPEAQELPRVEYSCIDCMVKNHPNALGQALPKSIERIRQKFGEGAVREVHEMTQMPVRELDIDSMKDPSRWA